MADKSNYSRMFLPAYDYSTTPRVLLYYNSVPEGVKPKERTISAAARRGRGPERVL